VVELRQGPRRTADEAEGMELTSLSDGVGERAVGEHGSSIVAGERQQVVVDDRGSVLGRREAASVESDGCALHRFSRPMAASRLDWTLEVRVI